MPGHFFTSWDLWQEMTFVLAMAIVSVFCAGLVKLWWNNRLMKKKEVLDEEKRARVEEMRKTGLPMKRGNLVPFGVRAIQSGVEVDGIWISRPASLNELGEKLASSTTLAGGRDSDSQRKGQDYPEDEKSVRVTTTNLGPKQSPSSASIFQKLTDTESLDSSQSAAPPVSRFAYNKAKRHTSHPAGTLNEDTLRRLEGQSPQPSRHYETYIPTTTTTSHRLNSHPRRPSERSSAASSSAGSVKSTSGRSYTSSHSSKLYMAATARNPHAPGGLRRWSEKDGRDPFATPPPARTPSGFSRASQQGQEVMAAAPEPTFGPGDLHHLNRPSRRANAGFEVLPAGEVERVAGEGEVGERRLRSPANRLRKSGAGQIEERER